MSLISNFASRYHQGLCSQLVNNKNHLIIPSYGQHNKISNDKLRDSSNQTILNGIIFRQKQILQCLGLYELMVKQQELNTRNGLEFNNHYISVSVKLILADSMDKLVRVFLSEYNEYTDLQIKFAFIQRNFRYSDYQFLKISFVTQKFTSDIKVLLGNSSFDELIQILNRKFIRFHITPSINLQQNIGSRILRLQQLCSLDQRLSEIQFKDDKIQYTAFCTFNGKQNCFAIFTIYKIIIFQQKTFLKFIKKDKFIQKEYWIESKHDWISFQGKDHLLIFRKKMKEVSRKNKHVKYINSIKDQIPRQTSYVQIIQQKTIYEKEEDKKQAISYQGQIKCNYENQRMFLSQQHRKTYISEEKNQCVMKENKFEEKEQMVEEVELAPSIIKQNMSKQMVDAAQGSCQNMVRYYSSIMDEQINSQMVGQQQFKQVNIQNNLILRDNYQRQNSCAYEEQLLKCHYNTSQPSMLCESFKDDYFSKKRLEIEQSSIRTALEQNFRYDKSNIKQNCQNLLNRVSQSQIAKVQNNKSVEIDPLQKQRYVYSRQQSFLNLADRFEYQNPQFHELSLVQHSPWATEKQLRKRATPRLTDIHQISRNCLVGLTEYHQIAIYKRTDQSLYQKKQVSISSQLLPYNIFRTNSQDTLLFSEKVNNNLQLYHISSMKCEQIYLPYIKCDEIKDAVGINDNQCVLLTNNSIQIIDKRHNRHREEVYFKSNQLFERMDIKQSTAAVGRSDGLVKLFDIRILKPKSINNFNLGNLIQRSIKQPLSLSPFRKLRILDNLNIFCQYSSSSFIVDAENRQNKNIYSQRLRNSQRSFVEQYSVDSRILHSIDQLQNYQDQIAFSINKSGESVVSLYKNFQFHFERKQEKIKSWKQIESCAGQKNFYLSFNDFSDNSQLIQGVYHDQRLAFKVRPN